MTAVKVVDASALAALLVGEPEGPDIAVRIAGARLIAPTLLSFELANVCLVKRRRHAAQEAALTAAFALLPQLAVQETSVDLPQAVDLARQTGLTLYDASYLCLSRNLGAELVSLDKALIAAALAP